MTFLPTNTKTPFLPTSQIFPEDESQRLIVHTDLYNSIAQGINIREIAIYDLQEIVTGQQFFNTMNPQKKRFSFRRVYSFLAIAAGATLNIPHGLTNVTSYTHIYGTAVTSVPDNRPIPFTSATLVTDQIQFGPIDGTNIIIVNGATAPNITSGVVVLEYLKN